jgi:hypothetical protein
MSIVPMKLEDWTVTIQADDAFKIKISSLQKSVGSPRLTNYDRHFITQGPDLAEAVV